jgi:hypothetical protein
MKAHPIKVLLVLVTLLLASLDTIRAAAEENQPRMEAALHDLQAAKTSDTPAKDLHAAKDELQKARRNKRGLREVSIAKVDEAIAAAEAGDKDKLIIKIDAAIADIHNAMAHASGAR